MLLALPFKISVKVHISCMVDGLATPTPWKIMPHTPLLWLLTHRCRSFSTMVNRCRAFKSCLISAHSKRWPACDKCRSSSLRSTIAKKLQNTWPRIVASLLWKIGRVSNSDLTSRKTLSSCHNFFYLSATWDEGKFVLVVNTHLPTRLCTRPYARWCGRGTPRWVSLPL